MKRLDRRMHGIAARFLLSLGLLAPAAAPANADTCQDGAPAVVFDIDGTLTQDEYLFWTVRGGAPEAVQAYADLGYQVVLLSARPSLDVTGFDTLSLEDLGDFLGLCVNACEEVCFPFIGCYEVCAPDPCDAAGYLESLIDPSDLSEWLPDHPGLIEWLTTKWLEDNGFPEPDHLVLAPTLLVSEQDRFAYKADALADLSDDLGFHYAYGNMTSDYDAYASAAIPVGRVFAAKGLFASACEGQAGTDFAQCISSSYDPHTASWIDAQPPALLAGPVCVDEEPPPPPPPPGRRCGLGFELVFVLPVIAALRRRRSA
jgi:hypothetical protein